MNYMQIQIKIFLLIKTVAAETNPLCKSEIFENFINTSESTLRNTILWLAQQKINYKFAIQFKFGGSCVWSIGVSNHSIHKLTATDKYLW